MLETIKAALSSASKLISSTVAKIRKPRKVTPQRKRPRQKQTPAYRWDIGAGPKQAEAFMGKRDLHPGRSSSLRKLQKAYRIAGNAMEPNELRKVRK